MDLQRQYQALYEEALTLKAAGRQAEAEAAEQKAARLIEYVKNYIRDNPRHLQAAAYLLFLAEREWPVHGDHPDVLEKIQRAIAIREDRLGPNDPEVADALTQLAESHFLADRWKEAETLYRRAAGIYDCLGPIPNAAQAKCYRGLAQTLAALGQGAQADRYFVHAIEFHETEAGDKRILYFLYLARAAGLEAIGRIAEGQRLRQKAAGLLPKNNPGELGFQV